MTVSEAPSAELLVEDVRQLWVLACLLAQNKLTMQTAQCLYPLCAVECSTRTPDEQGILLQANVLLAEISIVACSNSKKADDRDLWMRRVTQTEKCIHSAESAIVRGISCSADTELRLIKAKFLLQQQVKAKRSLKDRRILEILCDGLKCCAIAENAKSQLFADFRSYFSVKLKACLVKMHATTFMSKYSKDGSDSCNFANNLRYIRNALPSVVDKGFLLWLVEATCHTAISSLRPGSVTDMQQLVEFGRDFFDKVALEHPVSREFYIHHLIVTGFYFLRTGKHTKVAPLLDQIQVFLRGSGIAGHKPCDTLTEAYRHTMLESIRATVVAHSDPKQGIDLAMNAIHLAQVNLHTYAQYSAIRLMLIAILFDMSYLYCELLCLQCRYADMGASIMQIVTLFATFKPDLERTIFYRFHLARCHTLIAKYATAIGKVKDACAHLNYVVDKVLPALPSDGDLYPDSYVSVWINVLEVTVYCCGVALNACPVDKVVGAEIQVKQIYPSRILLEWAARVLKLDGLRYQINQCCSVELRAKYNLALAKWIWATEGLSESSAKRFTDHAVLETLRPKTLTLLHEALQHMNVSVSCCNTTSEIMALFGPQLVALGEVERGEEMLTKAIGTSLKSKNVLLQTRLLADVFTRYSDKRLVKAQATVASKYEKTSALLQRRIASALGEDTTIATLLRWTAGGMSVKLPNI